MHEDEFRRFSEHCVIVAYHTLANAGLEPGYRYTLAVAVASNLCAMWIKDETGTYYYRGGLYT